ncbi:hypothetical protein H4R99_000271 [Coemansia sp. RSA 1722]|nr:hypothetical protein IWW45_000179 [Coemansia sp. RSA 485]KAJ2606637.1 hypothetical protein H4R99_000271 [Coemansia sp. RSA 1722]
MDSNMDLDPIESGTPQRAQNLASSNTAPFTPPYAGDSASENQGLGRDRRPTGASGLRGQRAGDSAAPESPSEGSGRPSHAYGNDYNDMEEDGYDEAPGSDHIPSELQGLTVDESETIIHRDFNDNFDNEWTVLK